MSIRRILKSAAIQMPFMIAALICCHFAGIDFNSWIAFALYIIGFYAGLTDQFFNPVE